MRTGSAGVGCGFCRRLPGYAYEVQTGPPAAVRLPFRRPAMQIEVCALRIGLAALAILGVLAVQPLSSGQQGTSGDAGVTHLKVTDRVVLTGVKRLGINLGQSKLLRRWADDEEPALPQSRIRGNELSHHPSLRRRRAGQFASIADRGFGFPRAFGMGRLSRSWTGAALGRRGSVVASEPVAGSDGCAIVLDSKGKIIGGGGLDGGGQGVSR